MPKAMKSMDGNTAAAHVAYAFTEVATIYPITPSSNMAEAVDAWAAEGRKNIFGQTVKVLEMQSEAGAAGAVHGSLVGGALTSTFTASQGLLLMLPNMYKIAGELLPGVFHVAARTVATHALSIFGDHSDVMAVRQTGFSLLSSGSVQEAMDLAAVAHLSAIKARVPFLHFFDGFRTSHEIQKIEVLDYEDLAKLVDFQAIERFKKNSLNPERPKIIGTAQNPDIFFQARESANKFYEAVPDIVASYMNEINKLTGRNYKPFNYYGDPNAENIIIAMGSVGETIEEVVDYLNAKGEKVGLIKVRLYRPFSPKYFFEVLPKSVKKIAVLDRTKEPGALGEPLYEDVKTLFYGSNNAPLVVGGRYGLSSKDTTPSQILAVFKNLKSDSPKDHFTIGITDDVTHLSLPIDEEINTSDKDTVCCKFWGFGSDGTVGANKDAIKIIGDNTDMYAQGYFAYDSKKSGGVTVSHLRFGKKPIRSTYLIDQADYIACHKQSYVYLYDVLSGLKKNGTFVLNTIWDESELDKHLPNAMKRYIAQNNINFYIINATKIAKEIGLGARINMIMQAAFFKLANIIPIETATTLLKEAIVHSYGKQGDKVINMNYQAVDRGIDSIVKVNVPESWKNVPVEEDKKDENRPEFIKNVVDVMNRLEGDKLPVSTFVGRENGEFPPGTAAYEKRGIAIDVPEWIPDNCIQCNFCSYVCPHAAIRPFLLNEEEVKIKPADFVTKRAIGKEVKGYEYRIQVSVLDCTGCGSCAEVCPTPKKALVMKPIETQTKDIDNWNFAVEKISEKEVPTDTVKNSQFARPLLEFSGACAGCGETPYDKLVTQLFGDRMIIATATGCSSIWGASAPSMPYCANSKGKGPAWGNSLFEDNAEYGLGIALSVKQQREALRQVIEKIVESDMEEASKAPFRKWLDNMNDPRITKEAALEIESIISNKNKFSSNVQDLLTKVEKSADMLVKKSIWAFGGDGWAYDIGFGGIDHVIASGEDINILVVDTEVYSNTGGQSSKSTPESAIAQFAAAGKRTKKKDLGLMATTYGYVYVAQIAMGADYNQTLKAIQEAESYPGPSLIIAYAPCIAHGIKSGMATVQEHLKKAVEAGYWHLYRYNPLLKKEGKNPFLLDSKEPDLSKFREFLLSEVRFSALQRTFPDKAEELYEKAKEDAKERYENYKRMASYQY
jgi:pyruvate-ferredoxin/flavodoxin oxidoreductase